MSERKAIPQRTKLRLFSDAAGHCQRPDCLRPLFPIEMGGEKHLAEMAHVIPHGVTGPRHEESSDGDFDVDSFENLILLCPTCHTIIDKHPDAYSRATLLGWKSNHLPALMCRQGIVTYESRGQARCAVVSAIAENKAIWHEYAPCDGASFEYDPESEVSEIWNQRMQGVILPNHFRIKAIIIENQQYLTKDELHIFSQYQEHIRGLAERHICGISGRGTRYPEQMDGIFS